MASDDVHECRAERVGEVIGRTYARATRVMATPIRRAPAPTWHWRVAYRAGSGLRHAAGAAARRGRTAPRRLLDGLRTLMRRRGKGRGRAGSVKSRAGRAATVAGGGWWAWQWAAAEGVLPWALTGAAGLGAAVAYAAGSEPEQLPERRRKRPRHPAPVPAFSAPAEEEPELPALDPLLTLCAQLIGDARGVHLDTLVAAVNEAAPHRTREGPEVRAALAQRGVPTRPSVGAPGGGVPGAPRKVRRGVHREDLEAVIGPLSDLRPAAQPSTVATPATPPLTSNVADPATAVAAPATPLQPTRESA
ncbi:hypothetical protein LHJ74_14630 [Streptomyces sp. N2-109]|uniref:Uncharacterized protein n=1 Tax=Streptomyces gossypii TaxID=2883101 RepID=A0ABT2JV12_9ACTN|nr:hypothetical protein [Streptomyces gossypii]MCT2591129.1 hypothetical protein [Streptomyces gossypii]